MKLKEPKDDQALELAEGALVLAGRDVSRRFDVLRISHLPARDPEARLSSD